MLLVLKFHDPLKDWFMTLYLHCMCEPILFVTFLLGMIFSLDFVLILPFRAHYEVAASWRPHVKRKKIIIKIRFSLEKGFKWIFVLKYSPNLRGRSVHFIRVVCFFLLFGDFALFSSFSLSHYSSAAAQQHSHIGPKSSFFFLLCVCKSIQMKQANINNQGEKKCAKMNVEMERRLQRCCLWKSATLISICIRLTICQSLSEASRKDAPFQLHTIIWIDVGLFESDSGTIISILMSRSSHLNTLHKAHHANTCSNPFGKWQADGVDVQRFFCLFILPELQHIMIFTIWWKHCDVEN